MSLFSISSRVKANSVSEAEGKPISISLKPTATSRRKSSSFSSTLIGMARAWLPSRRSTEHQIGAWVRVLSGQRRSDSFGAKAKGRYFFRVPVFMAGSVSWISVFGFQETKGPGKEAALVLKKTSGGNPERLGWMIPRAVSDKAAPACRATNDATSLRKKSGGKKARNESRHGNAAHAAAGAVQVKRARIEERRRRRGFHDQDRHGAGDDDRIGGAGSDPDQRHSTDLRSDAVFIERLDGEPILGSRVQAVKGDLRPTSHPVLEVQCVWGGPEAQDIAVGARNRRPDDLGRSSGRRRRASRQAPARSRVFLRRHHRRRGIPGRRISPDSPPYW